MPEKESNLYFALDEWQVLRRTDAAQKLVEDLARHSRAPQSVNFPGAPDLVAVLGDRAVVNEIATALGLEGRAVVTVSSPPGFPFSTVSADAIVSGQGSEKIGKSAYGTLQVDKTSGRVTGIQPIVTDLDKRQVVELSERAQDVLTNQLATLQRSIDNARRGPDLSM